MQQPFDFTRCKHDQDYYVRLTSEKRVEQAKDQSDLYALLFRIAAQDVADLAIDAQPIPDDLREQYTGRRADFYTARREWMAWRAALALRNGDANIAACIAAAA